MGIKETLTPELQAVLERLQGAVDRGKSVLLVGPQGCGKTMIASRVRRMFWTPSSGKDVIKRLACVPGESAFRAPHHTCSLAGIVGVSDDKRAMPGELSLAHGGVLFLDEFAEFRQPVVEAVAKAYRSKRVEFGGGLLRFLPADFALIAAMGPCYSDSHKRRADKLSAIVRFDLVISMPKEA